MKTPRIIEMLGQQFIEAEVWMQDRRFQELNLPSVEFYPVRRCFSPLEIVSIQECFFNDSLKPDHTALAFYDDTNVILNHKYDSVVKLLKEINPDMGQELTKV